MLYTQPRSQASPIFVLRFAFNIIHGSGRMVKNVLPLPCIILNANQRTKNGGGLGTRLLYTSFQATELNGLGGALLCCDRKLNLPAHWVIGRQIQFSMGVSYWYLNWSKLTQMM